VTAAALVAVSAYEGCMNYKKEILICFNVLLISLMLWQGGSCHQVKSGKMSNNANAVKEAGVSEETNQSKRADKASSNVWGGEHIRLTVNARGAEIEYDCAHGTITAALPLKRGGKFELTGTHVREHGGPIRLNQKPAQLSARYTGSINGKTMTLAITLPDTAETIGNYTLTRGSAGRVWKCR
jgi:diaminopimelate epimerase